MESMLRVLATAAGLFIVAATVGSAIKTVVLPRASASSITRWVFLAMRRVYLVVAPRSLSYERRDRRLASYAPISLTVTLAVWLMLVFVGYTLVFMGVDGLSLRAALTLSGSSCSRSASPDPPISRPRCSSSPKRRSGSSCSRS